jgi:hypothetical protein
MIQELTHECRAGCVSGVVRVIDPEVGIGDESFWPGSQIVVGVQQPVGFSELHQGRSNGVVLWGKRRQARKHPAKSAG